MFDPKKFHGRSRKNQLSIKKKRYGWSKVIEIIVASQLTGYLQENKLFPDPQSAYRQGHSKETALLKIFSDILYAADSAQATFLGLLDLSAAFNTIDHDIRLTLSPLSPTVQPTAASRPTECIVSVEQWMRSNRLKLNSDRSQFMWLGSKQQLAKIETPYIPGLPGFANLFNVPSNKIIGMPKQKKYIGLYW